MFRTLRRVIFKLFLISLLLSYISCVAADHLPKDTTPRFELGQARNNRFITIQIDADFPLEKKMAIGRAMDTWERVSNYTIKFEAVWDVSKPGYYYQRHDPPDEAGLFFWNLPKSLQHLNNDMMKNWETYYGLWDAGRGENSGNIIVFEYVDMDKFYSIALHELGHMMGLSHIEPTWSVMHPTEIAECITPLDAQQFCQLYNCIPVPECDQQGHMLDDSVKNQYALMLP